MYPLPFFLSLLGVMETPVEEPGRGEEVDGAGVRQRDLSAPGGGRREAMEWCGGEG